MRIKFLIGLYRWHWQLNIFMIERFCIVIWKLRTFLWIRMVPSKLVILELLEYCSILMIAPKPPLVLHTIYHPRFVKKSHTIRNQIFGHLVASWMRWLHWDMPLMPTRWRVWFWKFWEEVTPKFHHITLKILRIWLRWCSLRIQRRGLQWGKFWKRAF